MLNETETKVYQIAIMMGLVPMTEQQKLDYFGFKSKERLDRIDPADIPMFKSGPGVYDGIYLSHLEYNTSWAFLMPAYYCAFGLLPGLYDTISENHPQYLEEYMAQSNSLNLCLLGYGDNREFAGENQAKENTFEAVAAFALWHKTLKL